MGPIRFTIAVHTENPGNASFGNTRVAAIVQNTKDRKHRDAAREATLEALRRANVHPADILPVDITLVRCSSGRLDPHDGPQAALKRVVDGIALALGIDDGGPFVEWHYDQAKAAPRTHGVVVTIVSKRADARTRAS